jgi:hypothetical protein
MKECDQKMERRYVAAHCELRASLEGECDHCKASVKSCNLLAGIRSSVT